MAAASRGAALSSLQSHIQLQKCDSKPQQGSECSNLASCMLTTNHSTSYEFMSENVPILILLLYDCGRCEYIYCMD